MVDRQPVRGDLAYSHAKRWLAAKVRIRLAVTPEERAPLVRLLPGAIDEASYARIVLVLRLSFREVRFRQPGNLNSPGTRHWQRPPNVDKQLFLGRPVLPFLQIDRHSIDGIYKCMSWDVEYTDEFEDWWYRANGR